MFIILPSEEFYCASNCSIPLLSITTKVKWIPEEAVAHSVWNLHVLPLSAWTDSHQLLWLTFHSRRKRAPQTTWQFWITCRRGPLLVSRWPCHELANHSRSWPHLGSETAGIDSWHVVFNIGDVGSNEVTLPEVQRCSFDDSRGLNSDQIRHSKLSENVILSRVLCQGNLLVEV